MSKEKIIERMESIDALMKRAVAEIARLRSLVCTYGDMPFPAHDYMTTEQWKQICHIITEERRKNEQ